MKPRHIVHPTDNVWKLRKHGAELCHYVFCSLYQSCQEQCLHEWQKYDVWHEPTFFLFFFAHHRQSVNQCWIIPAAPRESSNIFEAWKYLCCRSIDRTIQNLEMENIWKFSGWLGSSCPTQEVILIIPLPLSLKGWEKERGTVCVS